MLNFLRRRLNRFHRLQSILRIMRGHEYVQVPRGHQPIFLDYPVKSEPRYGHGRPSHEGLERIISRRTEAYMEFLGGLAPYAQQLSGVPTDAPLAPSSEPYWNNGLLPNMDALVIYGLLAQTDRKLYVEVGSGNSTKFARRAIRDHKRNTRIISIDPEPRADIDKLCDVTVRSPVERVDLAVFDQLGSGDVLFVDNSHRAFMNSDVTVFFMDILPRLRPGVIVGIHDICLPDDYPPEWDQKYFSEQYLLACSLLAESTKFEIVLPAWFCTHDQAFKRRAGALLEELYQNLRLPRQEPVPHGCACWLRILPAQ